MSDNMFIQKGSPFGRAPTTERDSEKTSGEDVINFFKSLIGNRIDSQSQPNIEAIRVNLVEDPEIKTPKIKTPKAVQQIGDLERGLASLPEAIPTKVDLDTVVARPTKKQIADAMREGEPKEKEVKEYNLSGPDYQADVATFREKADEEKIISTPTDTSRYTFTPSQLYKGIKNNDEGLINNIYSAIAKKEWKGQQPLFDFVGYDKGIDSSAFGPGQIVYSTAEPLLKDGKIKDKDTQNFTKKMVAAQKLFKNMYDNRKKRGKYLPEKASNTPKAAGYLKDLGITREQFLNYVDQGYFLPSNHPLSKARRKKGLVTGIPLELLGDNYKENYFNLFKTVLKQKAGGKKIKSLERTIKDYHGTKETKKINGEIVSDPLGIKKNKEYQEDVFKNLFDTTNPYDKPIKDNETEVEVRPSYQPINTKKQSGGMIESDPYKRQPRFI